jgi:hypothetical protein
MPNDWTTRILKTNWRSKGSRLGTWRTFQASQGNKERRLSVYYDSSAPEVRIQLDSIHQKHTLIINLSLLTCTVFESWVGGETFGPKSVDLGTLIHLLLNAYPGELDRIVHRVETPSTR